MEFFLLLLFSTCTMRIQAFVVVVVSPFVVNRSIVGYNNNNKNNNIIVDSDNIHMNGRKQMQKKQIRQIHNNNNNNHKKQLSSTSPPLLSSMCLEMGFFRGLFGEDTATIMSNSNYNNNKNKKRTEEIMELKRSLVAACDDKSLYSRSDIETIIEQLSILSPIQDTAISKALYKKWIVLWTTEKEINFFLDTKLTSTVSQTIDDTGTIISNAIPFGTGQSDDGRSATTTSTGTRPGLYVDGTIQVSVQQPEQQQRILRTDFIFTKATIDIGFLQFNVPPIGKGWFDTVYLDDTFRIDTNSRNDILIAVPGEEY